MDVKKIDEAPLEVVTMDGVSGTRIQWLWGREPGSTPSFAMRRFVMEPGGTIPLHGHPWEHEIYFLRGTVEVFTDTERETVGAGATLFVPPDEPHGYRNVGDEDVEFLCVVPNAAVR